MYIYLTKYKGKVQDFTIRVNHLSQSVHFLKLSFNSSLEFFHIFSSKSFKKSPNNVLECSSIWSTTTFPWSDFSIWVTCSGIDLYAFLFGRSTRSSLAATPK